MSSLSAKLNRLSNPRYNKDAIARWDHEMIQTARAILQEAHQTGETIESRLLTKALYGELPVAMMKVVSSSVRRNVSKYVRPWAVGATASVRTLDAMEIRTPNGRFTVSVEPPAEGAVERLAESLHAVSAR